MRPRSMLLSDPYLMLEPPRISIGKKKKSVLGGAPQSSSRLTSKSELWAPPVTHNPTEWALCGDADNIVDTPFGDKWIWIWI